MSALAVLQEARQLGIKLDIAGDHLRVSAPRGVLVPELRIRLEKNKSSLLNLLRVGDEGTETPSQKLHGIPLADLHKIAGRDWPDLRDDPQQLEALAHAVATRRMREKGEVPAHYTARSYCPGCGPIWLWEGAPARVLACPWCFNRLQGLPIPRPESIDGQSASGDPND